ncbi:MAG: CSLREA domain-containing protein [Anaerolineales bacterium]|nr:CSLREA domain-containing protein [Anaerolineales bacterium]
MLSVTTRRSLRFAISLALLLFLLPPLFAGEAGGSGWWVNTADDSDDGLCDAAHCSLREAINISNATPDMQLIAFDIPGSGPHFIELCDPLPAVTDSVIIDASTEPDYPYNLGPVVAIAPSQGASCAPPPYGLWIDSGTTVIRGLSIVGFDQPGAPVSGGIIVHSGNAARIDNNYIGLEPGGGPRGNRNGILLGSEAHEVLENVISGNTYGIHALVGGHVIDENTIGTTPDGMSTNLALRNTIGVYIEPGANNNWIGLSGTGNLISGNGDGIYIASSDNQIVGNFIGTNRTGTSALGNGNGIHAANATNLNIGGTVPGETNLISGNITGINLSGFAATIWGNFIGTDFSGSAAIPNQVGISVQSASYILIGGTGTGQGNLISGNSNTGIILHDFATHVEVVRNKIGTDITGSGSMGNGRGIFIQGNGNFIGHVATHGGNIIAYNVDEGILLVWSASQNLIEVNDIHDNGVGIYAMDDTTSANPFTENSIFANGALGIDLAPWGVNPNDPGDVDSGANDRLNYPEFTSVGTSGATGTACSGCTVEVYKSDSDPSGHGEGQSLVGSVIADVNGDFNISYMFPLATCNRISATATDSSGNTSEFSNNWPVGLCFSIDPSWFYLIEIIIFIIIWFGVRQVGIRAGLARGTAAVAGGLGGLLVVAGVFALILVIPNVELVRPPEETYETWSGLPACEHFLEPGSRSPVEGAIFEGQALPDLTWALASPLGEDQRWLVELLGPSGEVRGESAAEGSVALSKFGILPEMEGMFAWRLTGETLTEAGDWQPYCNPTVWLHFQLGVYETLDVPPWSDAAPPESEAPQPSEPEPIGEQEEEAHPPVPCIPTATALMNVTCRFGPDKAYKDVGFLLEGESSTIDGRNTDSSWWWILNPDAMGHCWVWSGAVEATCIPEDLPLIAAEPLPPDRDESPACHPDLNRSECVEAGGVYVVTGEKSVCQCP